MGSVVSLIKSTVSGFIADNALTRGAAIAYYTIFAIAPLLLIVIAIAGLIFGQDAAQQEIVGQLSGLMGQQSAEMLQTMIHNARGAKSGTIATIIGFGALVLTASGAFGEIQAALNAIWKAEPKAGLSRLVRARIAGLGLVLTLGFLMIVSLVVSAGLSALGTYLKSVLPMAYVLMWGLDLVISLGLLSFLFAAIYKVLPDKSIAWGDVAVGSVVTALLFTIGKSLIGLYIGSSQVASSYGAAGALIVILLWVYYSAQIFLFGAEFTRAYAERHGTHADKPGEGLKATFDRESAAPGASERKEAYASVPFQNPSADRCLPAAPVRPRSLISQLLGTGLAVLVLFLRARDRHRPAPG